MSDTILNEALKNDNTSVLIQCMSFEGDQRLFTGIQANIFVKVAYMILAAMAARQMKQARRIPMEGNTRRYWKTMDAFVAPREML